MRVCEGPGGGKVPPHAADVDIDIDYVDTHGASIVGFAFAHLLHYSLLPRLKNIGAARLNRPDAGDHTWSELAPILSRRCWELIAQQYDQLVKYATALRLGTAEAEQVLRRFTRVAPSTRPTRQSKSWVERCGPRSSATTWPIPRYGGKFMKDCRWWRTGTRPTPPSSTARTVS